MAKFKVSAIKQTTRVDPRFKTMNHIKKIVDRRLDKLRKSTNNIVQSEIEKAVTRSRVYRALTNPPLGVRGYDLPAEFGLLPGEGEDAANLLLYILKNTGDATVETGAILRRTRLGTGVATTTRVSFLDPAKYVSALSKRPFWHEHPKKYKNKRAFARRVREAGGTFSDSGTGARIDWMQWLLNARRGDNAMLATLPSLKNYGISYDIQDPAFSRSGRALMLNRDKQRNRKRMPLKYFPYSFPEVGVPKAGAKNFIEEIATDKKFTGRMNNRIKAAVERILIR